MGKFLLYFKLIFKLIFFFSIGKKGVFMFIHLVCFFFKRYEIEIYLENGLKMCELLISFFSQGLPMLFIKLIEKL